MSDPKLKEAMAEITPILKKHDIAGHIILVSPTASEFKFFIEPSWSCVRIEPNGDGTATCRFRSKKADFKSKDEQHRVTEQSVWMILGIKDLAAATFIQMEAVEKILRQHIEIDHTPLGGFEPHREQ